MKLKELIRDIPVRRVINFNNVEIAGLAYDSRKVRPNFLFAAIPGTRKDGHAYIYDAIDRGVSAVLMQRKDIVIPSTVAGLVVDNTRQTLAQLAAVFFGHPSKRLQVTGITGTKGKTTTAYLLQALHQQAGENCGLISTINYQIGKRAITSSNTTPESLDLQEMMAEIERSDCRSVVMEVSSHGSDQGRIAEIHFDTGLLTNVASHEHLDYHGTFKNYLQAKIKFFSQYLVSSEKKNKVAVINLDEPVARHFLSALAGKDVRVVTCGKSGKAQVRLVSFNLDRKGNNLKVMIDGQQQEFFSPLLGLGNVYNALLTIAYGWARNFHLDIIRAALSKQVSVPGRFEIVDAKQPFSVVVDYAHTADSLKSLLLSVRALRPERIIVVFGCGGDRDRSKRPLMGAVAARLADLVIITSDNPRSENPLQIIQDIMKGISFLRRRRCVAIVDRREAIRQAISFARPGDFVAIAGKGHETYQIFQKTVIPFDDRVEVRKALEDLALKTGREKE